MTLTTATISDIYDDIEDLEMVYTAEDETETELIDTDTLKNFLIKYADWSFLYLDSIDAIDAFNNYWTYFASQNVTNMYRAYIALTEEYNPLHNYDKNSTITTDNTEHTDTQDNPEITTTSSGGTTTNTNSTVPYDGTDFIDKEKNTNVIPEMTSTISEHEISTTFGATSQTVTENTYGNIGVTTSAQMLTGELQVRVNNLTDYILNQFVKQYLFLSDTI